MKRARMQECFGDVYAYFAPVNRSTETGTVFDPSAGFDLNNPPAPWIHVGRVQNFKRSSATSIGAIRTGQAGAVQAQYRKAVDARVSLDFCEWGKLQMALAASSQHMNVLASNGSQPRASGGVAVAATPILTGSTATLILVATAALSNFSVGDMVVVDVDFVAGATELGSGITGGTAAATAQMDADAIRRVSYNVARVAAVTSTGLQLDAPLLGGVPAATAQVQKVMGFVDREGGSFFQEWSALFALGEKNGGQVFYYYPRLQSSAPAEETFAKLDDDLRSAYLHAEFAAMASVDANNGETVVCYRSYIPAAGTPAY